jgi:predicted transcriptional regulator
MRYAIIPRMKRTTIFIDEAIERDLRAIAERDCRPVSGLVREALGTYVARRNREGSELRFIAIGSSGRRDTAETHEELLWREDGSAPARSGRRGTRTGTPAALPRRNASSKKRG